MTKKVTNALWGKIKNWKQWQPRQVVLMGIVGAVLICSVVFQSYVRPLYNRWRFAEAQTRRQDIKFIRLQHNLSISASVDEAFAKLPPEVMRTESDERTLSQFFQSIEAMSRHGGMTLVNMKPYPTEAEATHRIYPIRLTVSGKLQEVLQFVTDVAGLPEVTGIEGLSLRGAAHGAKVEGSLSLWMVRLEGGRGGTYGGSTHDG